MSQPIEYYVKAANWPNTLEGAKEFAKEAITTWLWKEKAPEFMAKVDRATSIKRVQELVIYPLLSGEGLGVVK